MATEGKGRADYLALGDWNAACYFCGRKRKASEMRRYWSGFWVCPEHWEPRQPQDFVRGVQDIQTVPWVQPIVQDFNLALLITESSNETTVGYIYISAEDGELLLAE